MCAKGIGVLITEQGYFNLRHRGEAMQCPNRCILAHKWKQFLVVFMQRIVSEPKRG